MNKEVPKWLQDLQESSWELELLISGGAIFSLFQASDFFIETIRSLTITNTLSGAEVFLVLGSFALTVLTMGFILHLVLRSFWLALVCINYVYPQGVQQERVRWKRPFKPEVRQGQDLYAIILRTDHLCGIVMYMSIISTFLMAGIMLLLVVLLSLPEWLFRANAEEVFNFYSELVILGLVLYLLDLLLFGVLRRIPYLSYVLYPVFRLFDLLSLRFLYQHSLWLFSTNVRKPLFALFAALFMGAAFLYSQSTIISALRGTSFFDQRDYLAALAPNPSLAWGYYLDETEGAKVRTAAIPSRRIDKPHLELFVVYRKRFDPYLAAKPEVQYVAQALQVAIDDSVYAGLEWFPEQKRSADQTGVTAMIPIRRLAEGRHVLQLINRADSISDDSVRTLLIPFWKENEL